MMFFAMFAYLLRNPYAVLAPEKTNPEPPKEPE